MPNGGLQTDCFLMLTWTDISAPLTVDGVDWLPWGVLFHPVLWGGCLVWAFPCSTDAVWAQEMKTALLHDLLGGQLHVCCPHLGVTRLLTDAGTGPTLLVFPIPR